MNWKPLHDSSPTASSSQKGRTFVRRMLSHGAPPESEILAAIERHLATQTGDACALPGADQRRPATPTGS